MEVSDVLKAIDENLDTNSEPNNQDISETQKIQPPIIRKRYEKMTKNLSAEKKKFEENIKTENVHLSHEAYNKSVHFEKNLHSKIISKESYTIVKFSIGKETFATKFKTSSSIEKVIDSLVDVLELETGSITLKNDGVVAKPCLVLEDFITKQVNSKLEFEILSWNGEAGRALVEAKVRENLPTLDVITVHTIGQTGAVEHTVVEIENQCCQKEWLGGYRNRLTNIEYHNAESQTAPKETCVVEYTKSGAVYSAYHRSTQTPFKLKDAAIDTVVNKGTQMWRPDLFIQSKTDKIMIAGSYVCFDEWFNLNLREEEVVKIQRAVRKWINRKNFRDIVHQQRAILEDVRKLNKQILKDQADKEREIITSSAFPVRRNDFYMLYLVVGKWWTREWKRICSLRSAEPRQAESVLLLQKEIQLLENIEKHRISQKYEALKKEQMRFLEQMARPITFKTEKGNMVSIDDLNTQRAREFKEIHSALINKDICQKDRVDLLLTLKHMFVSNFMDYEYAYDLVSLLEREIDLIAIGIKPNKLIGLQKRIKQLYIHFLKQKKFNPKAEKYVKPNFPKTISASFLCTRCLKLLPASKFPVHVRMREYSECTSCTWLKNIGHLRVDMSPYMKLLTYIQSTEMEKCCHSAVCFIFQPIGMRFLTDVIWHSHSAISECNDLSKLQHVRWLSELDWSPWNTILLTDQEAKCHSSIPDVFQFYDKTFIESVRQKHILARIQLFPLLKMDHEIQTSGAWASVKDSGPFLHHSHVDDLVTSDFDKI